MSTVQPVRRGRTDAAWAGTGQALAAVAGIAMVSVATRVLDKESVAALSWALAAAATAGVVGSLGIAPATIATVGRLERVDANRRISAFAVVGIIGTLGAISAWLAIGSFAAASARSDIYQSTVIATAALLPTAVAIQMCEAVSRSLGDFRLAAFLTDVVRRSALVMLLLIAAVTATRPDVRTILLFLPLFEAVALAVAFGRLRARGVRLRRTTVDASLAAGRTSATFLPAVLMAMIVPQFGVWIGGLVMASDDVADLSLAVRLSFAVNLPFAVLGRTLAPRIARESDPRRLEHTLRVATSMTSFFTVGCTVLLVVLGGPLLGVAFGDDYRSALWPLVVLSLGQSAVALTGYCGQLLTNTGHARVVGRVASIAAIAFIALAFVLGHLFGAVGIAAAAAVVQLVANVVLARTALQKTGVKTMFSLRHRPSLKEVFSR